MPGLRRKASARIEQATPADRSASTAEFVALAINALVAAEKFILCGSG